MDDLKPPAPPVGKDTSARVVEADPTIRDHVERAQLEPWQVAAIVARLHGTHDKDGERVFPDGVSMTTRMTVADFDQAAEVALKGRV